jgi:hypothetical protein
MFNTTLQLLLDTRDLAYAQMRSEVPGLSRGALTSDDVERLTAGQRATINAFDRAVAQLRSLRSGPLGITCACGLLPCAANGSTVCSDVHCGHGVAQASHRRFRDIGVEKVVRSGKCQPCTDDSWLSGEPVDGCSVAGSGGAYEQWRSSRQT